MIPTPPVYAAFSLAVASDLPLTDLPLMNAAPDVQVHIERAVRTPPADDAFTINVNSSALIQGWLPTVGAFEVSDGRRIIINPVAGATAQVLRFAIVGPLLGVILSQRGKFVLHASTVAIGGKALAFCGPSGAGKSTLAAALVAAGHRLVADDITVVDLAGAAPVVQPGIPRVKLWPDSAAALALHPNALPLVHPDRTKRSLQLTAAFQPVPLTLQRCYLLEDGPAHVIDEPSPTDAILSLVKCTYQSYWLHATHTSGANLLHCGALARSGVVRRLQRHRSFAALGRVVELIEGDAEESKKMESAGNFSDADLIIDHGARETSVLPAAALAPRIRWLT